MTQFCYVLEIGYSNGEAMRSSYDDINEAIGGIPTETQRIVYTLIAKVRCERHDDGLRYVKWLERPASIRFGDDHA